MKKLTIFICLITTSSVCLSAQETEPNYSNPQMWILGNFEYNQLQTEPHSRWFYQEYDNYIVDSTSLENLSDVNMEDIEILVVLGVWCSDSRREVPRFIKLMQKLNVDSKKITMLGVDSYKQAPIDDYEALNIERVPTFIFYKNKSEIGRIIEYPKTSLEKDMIEVLLKN